MFLTLSSTPSAAVASGSTLAFTLPNASFGEALKTGGHRLVSRGLQGVFLFPADFSMSVSGATLTVTYNGSTPIPAGTLVNLHLEIPGDSNYLDAAVSRSRKDYLGNPRTAASSVVRVLFGAVAAASATAVVNASARAAAATTTYASAVVLDVPRGLAVKSSNAGDTTQTVTVRGYDENGTAVTETFTLNGTTAVNGKKAFKVVVSDTTSAALAGNLSIGTSAGVLGLPFFLQGGTSAGAGYILKEVQDGAVPTAGTFVGGDLTKATATTGDVRGTWTPNAAPDGAKIFEVIMTAADASFLGVPQYGA